MPRTEVLSVTIFFLCNTVAGNFMYCCHCCWSVVPLCTPLCHSLGHTVRGVFLAKILKWFAISFFSALRQKEVKWLAQGLIATKYLRPFLNLGLPNSKPSALSTEPPSCLISYVSKIVTTKCLHYHLWCVLQTDDFWVIEFKIEC